jgi:hypothetical protein
MNIHEKRVEEINSICWHIFNEHGGYDYNDDMLYQLQGLGDSISECMNDEVHMVQAHREDTRVTREYTNIIILLI